MNGGYPSTLDRSLEDFEGRKWARISPRSVVVDDYAGISAPGRQWYYSRIGTDRGAMGAGGFSVNIGGGAAYAEVQTGWAGVWTVLMHNAIDPTTLSPTCLLGPYVKKQYQPYITGLKIMLADGCGCFKIELKDLRGGLVYSETRTLSGGPTVLNYSNKPKTKIKSLNWLVDGQGFARVTNVAFQIKSPSFSIPEAVFLFSYGHLSQCYDPETGLVRDRARWPVENYSSVPTTGLFALATAVARDLGYVTDKTAERIVKKIRNALQRLPRYHGLLPHFITDKDITPETEWSSMDTVVALVSLILACQSLELSPYPMEEMIQNIDWPDLTDHGSRSIHHGYDYNGDKIESAWDTFGSEAFILAVALAAATGGQIAGLDAHHEPPTWNGSGFNDELAALFFPMDGTDVWGNDWGVYRKEAYQKQKNYFIGHYYFPKGLFGLSAAEVPEPWTVPEEYVYGDWGVGGHNGSANDGSSLTGYPIIAPHYRAMLAAEYPAVFERIFKYLIKRKKVLTPLNNVESFGIDEKGRLHWNSLKGSWNLCLQLLGVSRALSDSGYLPYRALENNQFLRKGFDYIFVQN